MQHEGRVVQLKHFMSSQTRWPQRVLKSHGDEPRAAEGASQRRRPARTAVCSVITLGFMGTGFILHSASDWSETSDQV